MPARSGHARPSGGMASVARPGAGEPEFGFRDGIVGFAADLFARGDDFVPRAARALQGGAAMGHGTPDPIARPPGLFENLLGQSAPPPKAPVRRGAGLSLLPERLDRGIKL